MSFFSNNSDNNDSNKENGFTYYFIIMLLIMYVGGNLFRKSYNDPVIFLIDKTKYTYSDCKKYTILLDMPNLNAHQKFQMYHDYIKFIAFSRCYLSYLCDKLGILVSHEDVQKEIKNDYKFSEYGKFSRDKFLQYLKEKDITENEYYSFIEEELRHSQLKYLISNSYPLNSKFSTILNKSLSANRVVQYAVVDHQDVNVKYSEADLKNFYNANKSMFVADNEYTYKGIVLKREGLAKEDYTLITKMMENNNFEGIIKNYKAQCLSSEELEKAMKKSKNNFSAEDFPIGKVLILSANENEFTLIQVKTCKKGEIYSYNAIKSEVIRQYKIQNAAKFINTKTLKWKEESCNCDDYFKLAVPEDIAIKIFELPIKKLTSFSIKGKTYFFIIKSLTPDLKLSNAEVRSYVSKELIQSLQNEMLKRTKGPQ